MRSHLTLVALASLALAGCASQAPPAPEETLVEPPAPSTSPVEESFELGPVAPDVTLVIKASARAADGEALSLELRVRRPVPFDDVANQTVPAAAIQSCPGILDTTTVAQDRWTFTRVNFSAISPADSPEWPDSSAISIRPSTQFAPIASMSFLQEVTGAALHCEREKFIGAQGKGAISIGSANDARDPADGGYQRWAELNYGFVTLGTGVTLTDCTFELTPLGGELGGGNSSWTTISDSQNCVIGPQAPTKQF